MFIFSNIKMNKKTLTFNDIKLNKKEFHKAKELIDLFSVDLDQIVVSYWLPKRWNHYAIMYYFAKNEWIHKIF